MKKMKNLLLFGLLLLALNGFSQKGKAYNPLTRQFEKVKFTCIDSYSEWDCKKSDMVDENGFISTQGTAKYPDGTLVFSSFYKGRPNGKTEMTIGSNVILGYFDGNYFQNDGMLTFLYPYEVNGQKVKYLYGPRSNGVPYGTHVGFNVQRQQIGYFHYKNGSFYPGADNNYGIDGALGLGAGIIAIGALATLAAAVTTEEMFWILIIIVK